jgi:hypothetical protein
MAEHIVEEKKILQFLFRVIGRFLKKSSLKPLGQMKLTW